MTNNQAVSGRSQLSSREAVRFTLRIGCCFSFALFLYACSATQTITPIPKNEVLALTTGSTLAPADNLNPPVAADKAIAPISDENNIYFALRSAMVDETQTEKLQHHAHRLKMNRKQIVSLVGQSDDQGSRNYNLAITEERLMSVERLLRSYGVPARQIRIVRVGRVKNPVPCTTNECRQQMRRVELIYSP
ncbi:MAG: OmpA family protein [Propionivibrio sp.]|uniref:OmpA family protein n=1 Tax=Propionivibrio sp. TaxID=2212460 RepID=UPI001A5B51BF|nr:OmpA family protein [Propionivibrio sp.]MBL8414285.1 OmpA family protein [Propionivibrio sp.]